MANLLYLMAFPASMPRLQGDIGEQELPKLPHCTLLPAFSLADEALPLLLEGLSCLAPWFSSLTFLPREVAVFGLPEKQIPVMTGELVGATPEESGLLYHQSLKALVEDLGGGFAVPEFTGEHFQAHVSWLTAKEPLELPLLMLVEHQAGFGRDLRTLWECLY